MSCLGRAAPIGSASRAFLAKRGVQAPRLLEFGTLEAIFKCVAAGLGITLLPRSVAERMGGQSAGQYPHTAEIGRAGADALRSPP